MSKVSIVYWSQTGNTEAMAEAIGQGVKQGNGEASVVDVSHADLEEVKNAQVIVLGCPAMGAEELEDGEMEPFITSLEANLNGKSIALFGSYGWGDGQWMRDWEERMQNAGAILIQEGLICQETPDDETLEACKNLGKIVGAMTR
ncbi:flavodoxin [Anaerosporobacter faecicola]|uniref:flavodoxin n=1 Tax=Anaerosporobacter faecicola TaxID=2718714 RepID=UPI0014397BB6|nr:flavodoxin [Anaerosporobacter faecicola]